MNLVAVVGLVVLIPVSGRTVTVLSGGRSGTRGLGRGTGGGGLGWSGVVFKTYFFAEHTLFLVTRCGGNASSFIQGYLTFFYYIFYFYTNTWVYGVTITGPGWVGDRDTSVVIIVGKSSVATKSGLDFLTGVNDIRPAVFTGVVSAGGMEFVAGSAMAIVPLIPDDGLSADRVFTGFVATDSTPRGVPALVSFRDALGVSFGSASPERETQVVMALT